MAQGVKFSNAVSFLSLLRNMDLSIPVKNLKRGLSEDLFTMSSEYLGIPVEKVKDKDYLWFFITENFSQSLSSYLDDEDANFCFTLEHGTLFYYRSLFEGYDERIVRGVTSAIYAQGVSEDVSQIKASTTKGVFKTKFLLDINNLHLKGVKNFQRSYLRRLLLDDNEVGYYLEKPFLATIAYLMSKGFSFEKAKNFINNTKSGLFYTWLPLEVEDRLLPYILSGKFDTDRMNGYFASTLKSDMDELDKNNLGKNSYYNRFCKPIMLEMMGVIVNDIKSDMLLNGISHDIVKPYYASERCLAVKVFKLYDLKTVFPNMHKYFNRVEDLSASDLFKGFWV